MPLQPNHPQRRIKRILIANRGEIAIRLLQACHELEDRPTTIALYTTNDSTHITLGRPDEALQLPSPASYMDINYLVDLAKKSRIDAIHPGYGFLSESSDFSRRMWEDAQCLVVGPGFQVLERTGDKLAAKQLARESNVPVLEAMDQATGSVEDVRRFADNVGYPIMIKAIDGGGGRGIRLVRKQEELSNAVERSVGESPSKKVFAEQAAVAGFKHIEIQIIGDGQGGVRHLWERDCSVQRRFQKIVEVAPTPTNDREVICRVIEAAVRMAESIRYLGLGTFEFLVNIQTQKFFFLEINPRLQVEHTISESIADTDLVREQLLIAQGLRRLEDTNLAEVGSADTPPSKYSIQLRLCAEDPNTNFALSIGKITDVRLPSGNGIRVDSHLSKGGAVGSDFDNLMAKIIVTAPSWKDVILKSRRALADTLVVGVKTNLSLLRAIIDDQDFQSGNADTQWLETKLQRLVKQGQDLVTADVAKDSKLPIDSTAESQPSSSAGATATALRKGDAWSLKLDTPGSSSGSESASHHLRIDKISRNEFPSALVASVSHTAPGQQPKVYNISLNATSSSADATASRHRRGDPNNKSHVILPMSGKLVEVLVEEGDRVEENQVVAFVKQMKMELEIRSPRAGTAKWVIELEDEEAGDDAAEGVLLLELEEDKTEVRPDVRSRL